MDYKKFDIDKIPNIPLELIYKVLKVKNKKSLDKFLRGQTGILRGDGYTGVYLWDFISWLEKETRRSDK